MPSCERILLPHFHSRESRHYTENSVQQLMQSKQFQLYAGHMEYGRQLQLTWFVAPIGLMIAFYYHLLFLFREPHEAHAEVPAANSFIFLAATALLLFFVAPCVVIAPFTGFFEPLLRRQALGYMLLFTCINVAVTSFGGKWFHYPPCLLSHPRVPWITGRVSELQQAVLVTLTRVLPLQGAVVAGWLVYKWRQMRWKSAWHVPLPLFSVPVFVGLFTCLWFRAASLLLSSSLLPFFSSFSVEGFHDGDVTANDMGGLLALSVIRQEILDIITGRSLSAVLANAGTLYSVWCATLGLSVLYFVGVLLSPLCVLFRGVLRVLPTHPTTWGLMLVFCVAGVSVLARDGENGMAYLLGLLLMICALFYNGFVLAV